MISKKMTLLVIAIIVAVLVVFWIRRHLQIDGCLDAGGRWNYEQKACEYK
jgi:hypothetical protein